MTDRRWWSPAARAGWLAAALVAFEPAMALDSSDLISRALAAPPDSQRGASLYADRCSRCHEAAGSGAGKREFPQLAGQQREYLVDELAQFISVERRAPTMHQVLVQSALTDPQSLSDLSAYLAAQPRDPHPEHGDAHRLGRGREIYRGRCAQCHGDLGQGRFKGPVPAVGGQNYTYLVSQLHGFAAGHRSKASPELIDAMGKLSSDDILAVADFLSRLPQSAGAAYGEAP